jgi:hypothetical protein
LPDAPLRPLAENLWVADRPFKIPGGDMGTRMTVVRLSDGGLPAQPSTRSAFAYLPPR